MFFDIHSPHHLVTGIDIPIAFDVNETFAGVAGNHGFFSPPGKGKLALGPSIFLWQRWANCRPAHSCGRSNKWGRRLF